MAFKLRSPLHEDDNKNKMNFATVEKPTGQSTVERASLGNALSQTNADNVPTPSADTDSESKETSFDKLKAKIDAKGDVPVGGDKNAFLKGRIALSTNPAQAARLKGKLAKREEKQAAKLAKQTERAKAINVRNFGNEQGLSEMEIADKEATSFDKEWDMIEQEAKLNRNIKPTETQDDKGSFGLNTTFNKSPFEMKVNRAGRSKESGLLMTSPVLKTGKHSYKGAVAKMKMQNIAQTPLYQKDPPKKPVGAIEDIYKTATKGFTDAVLTVPAVLTGNTDKIGMHSKKWLKEKKARTTEKKSGFNPNQAG